MNPFAPLGRLAGRLSPLAPLFLRVAVGWVFLRHGIAKVHWGVAGVGGMLHGLGFPVSQAWAVVVMAVETVGAGCVVLGLWTRFWAACMAVEMVVAISRMLLPSGKAFELEGLLLAGSLALLALGDGTLSIGAIFRGKKGA